MIDALIADAVYPRPGGLRAACGHLSMAVECPNRDSTELLESETGNIVIFSVLEIEGDRISVPVLVGFASERRRDLYRTLRSLRGIGRRSAIAVLDCGEETDILRAVAGKDAEFFRAVPGLGKTRIPTVIETLATAYDGALPKALPIPVSEWMTARDALVGEGRSTEEAEALIRRAVEQGSTDAEGILSR